MASDEADERLGQSLFEARKVDIGGYVARQSQMHTIDTHTGGEPLRIVVSGMPPLRGVTVLEKRRYCMENLDYIRTRIINEPRGHTDMYGAVLTPAADDAHLDVFFLNGQGYSTMCGHAILAIAKVVVEMGAVEVANEVSAEAQTEMADSSVVVRMNTPAGRVTATASYNKAENRVSWVRFNNVPSFVAYPSQEVEVPDLGKIKFDVAFGGAFYAIVDAGQLKNHDLTAKNYRNLVSDAAAIKEAVVRKVEIRHPFERDLDGLFGVIFTGPSATVHSRNVNVFEDGIVDRSPTGTGVSARAALHYARGELEVGQEITIESIIGTRMTTKVLEETLVVGHNKETIPAVVPEVGGDAFVMGYSTFLFDQTDPLVDGAGVLK